MDECPHQGWHGNCRVAVLNGLPGRFVSTCHRPERETPDDEYWLRCWRYKVHTRAETAEARVKELEQDLADATAAGLKEVSSG